MFGNLMKRVKAAVHSFSKPMYIHPQLEYKPVPVVEDRNTVMMEFVKKAALFGAKMKIINPNTNALEIRFARSQECVMVMEWASAKRFRSVTMVQFGSLLTLT